MNRQEFEKYVQQGGKLFTVTAERKIGDDILLKEGEVIELKKDDGSWYPLFFFPNKEYRLRKGDGGNCYFLHLCDVEPLIDSDLAEMVLRAIKYVSVEIKERADAAIERKKEIVAERFSILEYNAKPLVAKVFHQKPQVTLEDNEVKYAHIGQTISYLCSVYSSLTYLAHHVKNRADEKWLPFVKLEKQFDCTYISVKPFTVQYIDNDGIKMTEVFSSNPNIEKLKDRDPASKRLAISLQPEARIPVPCVSEEIVIKPRPRKKDDHYDTLHQPIETMQANMTPEEFQGYVKGNIIKYVCRMGRKAGEDKLKEAKKIRNYAKWLIESLEGKTINPREDEQ